MIRDGVPVDSVLAAFQREVRARAGGLNTQLARRAAEILLDRQQIPSWQIHGVGLEAAEGFGRVLREGMVVEIGICFALFEVCPMVLVVSNHPDETFDHPWPARELRRVTIGTTAQLFARLRVGHWRCRVPQASPSQQSGAWGATV